MRLWPTLEQFKDLATRHKGVWICDTETDGLMVYGPMSRDKAWLVGLQPEGTGLVVLIDTRNPQWPSFLEIINSLTLVGHHFKFDVHAMNAKPQKEWYCTMAMVYHFSTTRRKRLDDLTHLTGKPKVPTLPQLKGPPGKQNRIHELTTGVNQWDEKMLVYLADDLDATHRIWLQYKPHDVHQWAGEVEWAVQRMEDRGFLLLEDALLDLRAALVPHRDTALGVLRAAGFDGNLQSPPQLAAWLEARGYDFWRKVWDKKLRQKVRKYSTDTKKVLDPFVHATGDALIESLITYRTTHKKIRDFCDRLPDFVGADGLIHGQIKCSNTATQRFAHAQPNQANIPKQGRNETERALAKRFRACFTGQSGFCSGGDYSQVELRVAAALSGDVRMLEAFANGIDLHDATAASTSGHSVDNLPEGERFKAKTTNFGILNNMQAKRLAVSLGCHVWEAQAFIDKHRKAHPELHEWMDDVTDEARRTHLVTGLDGSVRVYDKTDSINSAVSMKVQGGAALLMRSAVVQAEKADLRPIITVHDELVGDVKDKGAEYAEVMEYAANTYLPDVFSSVRFTVDGKSGTTWADI